MTPPLPYILLLVGYGNVAKRFATLLEEQRPTLARRFGLRARIKAVKTRRSSEEATVDFIRRMCTAHADAARDGRLVVVETTTLDVNSGEPAITHVRAALEGGAHVITANKGPVAFAYNRLARIARNAGRRFLFEGAVMDGIPVFNLVREALPGVNVVGFRGVVNTTTNYILTAMEAGQPFADALAEMQAKGIAEADPSLDLEGWDAAAKTAALANVLMGAGITPGDVDRTGISADMSQQTRAAVASGRRVKLVASARRDGARVVARVAPEPLASDDPLARIEGHQNALILQTDLLDEIAIVQRGSSLTHTAYALLSDLITVATDDRPRPATPRRRRRAPAGRSLSRHARRTP